MPAGVSAYTALANVTLGSSASSVTFSSISQSFRDLVVVANYAGTGNGFTRLTVNSDTGGNYFYVSMRGNGSVAGSYGSSGDNYIAPSFPFEELTTNQSMMVINFLDYSTTDKHKSGLFRLDATSQQTNAGAFRYASTSALTSFRLQTLTNNYAAGSTFALYGVSA